MSLSLFILRNKIHCIDMSYSEIARDWNQYIADAEKEREEYLCDTECSYADRVGASYAPPVSEITPTDLLKRHYYHGDCFALAEDRLCVALTEKNLCNAKEALADLAALWVIETTRGSCRHVNFEDLSATPMSSLHSSMSAIEVLQVFNDLLFNEHEELYWELQERVSQQKWKDEIPALVRSCYLPESRVGAYMSEGCSRELAEFLAYSPVELQLKG